MATRLEITHGLIAERDRLANSADTLSVTRPSTGSETRSKGVLFIAAASRLPGPRIREATALVAETIRHEYYYDESAGVPVCLEKAVRSADRRLRGSREGAGLPPGSIGVAAAVVRNNELYLATVGAVEAYLVRSARLLMPDRSAPAGLPSEESRSIDVWRGELDVGDALLLVSRNLTETVGTEELKSAVLTLHPQAAVNHLHHLFVAAGGEGSDALIAVEASEQTTRASGRGTPGAVGDAYGDLAVGLSEPLGGTVGTTAMGARSAVEGVRDRFWGAMPRRRTRARDMTPATSRAENQRRAAIGVMALVGVILLLGLFVIVVPRGGDVTEVRQVAGSDSALATAQDRAGRADNLLPTDAEAAMDLYREAWREIERARSTGLSAPALDELETRVRAGLDTLNRARTPVIRKITPLPNGSDPIDLVEGPRGGAIYIDRERATVSRVNTKNGKIAQIVHEGDKPEAGGSARIGTPVELAAAGPDVIIVDDQARPWRWRPSNSAGAGTLNRLTLQGNPTFGADHGDIKAYDPAVGDYRIYVAEPSQNQVLRYQQTFDGSAFSTPTNYLASQTAEVADFKQLYIDFDVYALIDDALRRHAYGKYQGDFLLEEPPDNDDVRPGHDYRLVSGSGRNQTGGRAYLYDALHSRVVGFSKVDGSYLGQWGPAPGGTEMDDMRGMYVIPGAVNKRGKRQNDTLVWVTPQGLFSALLPIDD